MSRLCVPTFRINLMHLFCILGIRASDNINKIVALIHVWGNHGFIKHYFTGTVKFVIAALENVELCKYHFVVNVPIFFVRGSSSVDLYIQVVSGL